MINRSPQLIKYGFDTFIYYDYVSHRFSCFGFIPELEASRYAGICDFPIEGWKFRLFTPFTTTQDLSPTFGIVVDAGIWKLLCKKCIFSVEATTGFPLTEYQETTTVFHTSYPGVRDISCDWYGILQTGMDIIVTEIRADENLSLFLACGLFAYTGYIDPDWNSLQVLPFALETRVSFLSVTDEKVQKRVWLGFAYAFDDTPSFGSENMTSKFFVGLNY
jgi:hypothetical protein